jgi:hypothetical protein
VFLVAVCFSRDVGQTDVVLGGTNMLVEQGTNRVGYTTMPRIHWGSYLTKKLARWSSVVLVGCGSPSASLPTSPPPMVAKQPALWPRDEIPDPPDSVQGWSAWVPLGKLSGIKKAYTSTNQQFIPFGRGVVVTMNFRPFESKTDASCLIRGYTFKNCLFLRTALWSNPKPPTEYRRPMAKVSNVNWSALIHVENEWGSYSAGDDVVFAFRKTDHLVIDTIHEKGEVKLFFEDKNSPSLTNGKVIPTASGILVLGESNKSQELSTISLKPVSSSSWNVGKIRSLGTKFLNFEHRAQDARNYLQVHKNIGYMDWDAVALLDKGTGKPGNQVVLVWTEVQPPPINSPLGKKTSKVKGSKNSCGSNSRSLDDESVLQITHLTKLSSEGVVESDIGIYPPNSITMYGSPKRVNLVATKDGFELNGVAYTESGHRKSQQPHHRFPTVHDQFQAPIEYVPPLHKIITAAYHENRNQGVVVYRQENDLYWVKFTALGKAEGDPHLISDPRLVTTQTKPTLIGTSEQWFLYDPWNEIVHVLQGAQAGKKIEVKRSLEKTPNTMRTWFFPKDKEHLHVFSMGTASQQYQNELGVRNPKLYSDLVVMMTCEIDLQTLHISEWELVPGWLPSLPSNTSKTLKKMTGSEEEKPVERLAYVKDIIQNKEGTLSMIGRDRKNRWFESRYNPSKKEWQKLKTLNTPLRSNSESLHPVWKDKVLVLKDKDKTSFLWLVKNAGYTQKKAMERTTKNDSNNPSRSDPEHQGPWYMENMLLPAAPGPLLATGPKIDPDCPMAFATGRHRMVFLCTKAPVANEPGSIVGTRILRYQTE